MELEKTNEPPGANATLASYGTRHRNAPGAGMSVAVQEDQPGGDKRWQKVTCLPQMGTASSPIQ